MSDEPGVLLAELRELRHRSRADRHGYAFPLFLFGALILLAPLCYVPADPLPDLPEFELTPVPLDLGPFPQFRNMFLDLKYPGLVGWYWMLTIVGGLAVTAWWYRQRARRLGVESDTRLPFTAAGAALIGFLLSQPVLETVSHQFQPTGLYSTPAVNLPILFGSAALAAVVLLWCSRPHRTEPLRIAGVFVGVLFTSFAFAALGVYLIRGYSALLAIAVTLLVLAWSERSVLLGAISVLFTGSAMLTNLYDMGNLFYRLGMEPHLNPQLFALQNLLLPAVVLLGGGVAALLTSRSHR